MNKPIGIVVLAALLLCSHASFIDHIYNSTHLRGNVKVDTAEGIKLGYDGGLYFDNGILGFEIASLGGNLKAAIKPSDLHGNKTNTTVEYSGDVQVSGGGYTADVSVAGTSGLSAEVEMAETSTGGNLAYNATLWNQNQWNASACNVTSKGKTGGLLNATGLITKDGNDISVQKVLKGAVVHNGTVGDKDNFTVIKLGELQIENAIHIRNQSEENGNMGSILPEFSYGGNASVKRVEYAEWNNDSFLSSGKGHGKFGGLIWYDKNDNNNTYIRSIKHARSADFIHGGKVKVNNKLHVLYGGLGVVNSVGAGEYRLTQDHKNYSSGMLDAGSLNHLGIAFVKPTEEDEAKLDMQLENMHKNPALAFMNANDDDSEVDGVGHHHKAIKTISQTRWGAGKGVSVHHNDDNTTSVATHGGAVWEVDGLASKGGPFHDHGDRSYNTSFVWDKKNSEVKDILVKFGKSPQTIEELKQKVSSLRRVAVA